MKKNIIQSGLLLLIAVVLFFLDGGKLDTFTKHFEKTLEIENCFSAIKLDEGDEVIATSTKVIEVIDGDTISIMNNCKLEHVRLIGVNTPETVDPRRPVQCFGKEASTYAKQTLSDKTITIETDSISGKRDKYGRLLGYIILADGNNFNKQIIQQGYAYESTYQGEKYKYQAEFKAAQKEAEVAKRGLWATDTCSGKK